MHLFYVDEAADEELIVYSAICLPVSLWRAALEQVRDFRRSLRRNYGIPMTYELHAWKFVRGQGRPSQRVITKFERAQIFFEVIDAVAALPGVQLFNACFPRKDHLTAFERLLNRLERTLKEWDSYGLLICDRGKEVLLTKVARRMGVFNPIPSAYGQWAETGQSWKNIPLERIVEDPVFKDSARSYFIQMTDFVAYSLLRRERPTPRVKKYGIDKAFTRLRRVLYLEASRRDPEGIIRP